MHIGVPKEVKQDEYRVGMIPAGVEELTRAGHRVSIETGAGLGSGITDEQYLEAGAEIVPIRRRRFIGTRISSSKSKSRSRRNGRCCAPGRWCSRIFISPPTRN